MANQNANEPPYRRRFRLRPLARTLYGPDANGWELWWRQHIRGTQRSLEAIFNAYMDACDDAAEEATQFRDWGERFEQQTLDERLKDGFDPFASLETTKAHLATARALASALLLALDALLSELRSRLRSGKTRCHDEGPHLNRSVTVDRALDAAGNWVRHEYEWRLHDLAGTWPNDQQLRSIVPLAQLSTVMPISGDDTKEAYAAYTEIDPPLLVLDLLSDYSEFGPEAKYETVQGKVIDAGIYIIKNTFARARG